MQLEILEPDTWSDFLGSETAVLMLGKSDCAACNAWTDELTEWLATDPPYADVRFGKILLDARGFADFKRTHGDWLKEIRDLPTTAIFRAGDLRKTFIGSGVDRLVNRLRRVRDDG